jgi:hypothetical protein
VAQHLHKGLVLFFLQLHLLAVDQAVIFLVAGQVLLDQVVAVVVAVVVAILGQEALAIPHQLLHHKEATVELLQQQVLAVDQVAVD